MFVKNRKTKILILSAPLLLVLIYFVMAVVVFEFSQPAFPYDEDNFNGHEVALGPRPRLLFCKRTHDGVNFEGKEWPFVVFQPLCKIWCNNHGYVPSAEWR